MRVCLSHIKNLPVTGKEKCRTVVGNGYGAIHYFFNLIELSFGVSLAIRYIAICYHWKVFSGTRMLSGVLSDDDAYLYRSREDCLSAASAALEGRPHRQEYTHGELQSVRKDRTLNRIEIDGSNPYFALRASQSASVIFVRFIDRDRDPHCYVKYADAELYV